MLMDWVGMKCFNQLCYRKYLCSGWAVWDGRKAGVCKCIKGMKYHKVSKKLIVFHGKFSEKITILQFPF